MKHRTAVYLGWARGAALADFIIARNGLEVSVDFEMPCCQELPDTMPKHPTRSERYYTEGGAHWQRRQIVELV